MQHILPQSTAITPHPRSHSQRTYRRLRPIPVSMCYPRLGGTHRCNNRHRGNRPFISLMYNHLQSSHLCTVIMAILCIHLRRSPRTSHSTGRARLHHSRPRNSTSLHYRYLWSLLGRVSQACREGKTTCPRLRLVRHPLCTARVWLTQPVSWMRYWGNVPTNGPRTRIGFVKSTWLPGKMCIQGMPLIVNVGD